MSSEGWTFFVFFMVLIVGSLSVIAYEIWATHDLEMAKLTTGCVIWP